MKTLSTFLQHDYFENFDLFVSSIKDEVSFKPAGVLIDTVTISDSEFSLVYFHANGYGTS